MQNMEPLLRRYTSVFKYAKRTYRGDWKFWKHKNKKKNQTLVPHPTTVCTSRATHVQNSNQIQRFCELANSPTVPKPKIIWNVIYRKEDESTLKTSGYKPKIFILKITHSESR
jgi:hypothetical protein